MSIITLPKTGFEFSSFSSTDLCSSWTQIPVWYHSLISVLVHNTQSRRNHIFQSHLPNSNILGRSSLESRHLGQDDWFFLFLITKQNILPHKYPAVLHKFSPLYSVLHPGTRKCNCSEAKWTLTVTAVFIRNCSDITSIPAVSTDINQVAIPVPLHKVFG